MKILQSSLFRAAIALCIGTLLIKYPDNTLTGITIAIGVLFLLSGVVSIITWYYAKRHVSDYKIYDAEGRLVAGEKPAPPIVGIGSVVLGFILALMPETFVSLQMYFIAVLLVLGAITQFMTLVAVRHYSTITLWYWFCPAITLLVGLFVLFKPMETATLPLTILGWCSLFYGVSEIMNAVAIFIFKRQLKKKQEQEQQQEEEAAIQSSDSNEIVEIKKPE